MEAILTALSAGLSAGLLALAELAVEALALADYFAQRSFELLDGPIVLGRYIVQMSRLQGQHDGVARLARRDFHHRERGRHRLQLLAQKVAKLHEIARDISQFAQAEARLRDIAHRLARAGQ